MALVRAGNPAARPPQPLRVDDPAVPRQDVVPGPGPRGPVSLGSPPAGTSALELAAVTGATIAREGSRDTVTFAAPPGEMAGSAPPVDDAIPAASASSRPALAAAAPDRPASSRSGAEFDDVYEQVMERLRHDLLVERERMGDLLDGLPR
jgi:hypothetical protein